MSESQRLRVRVVGLREEGRGIIACELRAVEGPLPPSPPGAHIDVFLPNGMTRQYSVANASPEHFIIAVKREPNSRGGSSFIADSLRIGTELEVGLPRDNFPLQVSGARFVLVAGGIGITALLPMCRRLQESGADWKLHYVVKSLRDVAFRGELDTWGGRVHLHPSTETGRLDVGALVRAEPEDAHFYCCGPSSMLDTFIQATASRPAGHVHLERFAPEALPTTGDSFAVRLAKAGITLTVVPGKSILDTLLDGGMEVRYSCQQGICGECEVRVLDGTPDHKDDVLSAAERASNDTIMVCCSRSKSAELVLDL